jgi:hypothetical protein
MKKILCFIALFLYVMGAVGGIGYCLYSHAYLIAIAVAVLGVMAFPTAAAMFKFLKD